MTSEHDSDLIEEITSDDDDKTTNGKICVAHLVIKKSHSNGSSQNTVFYSIFKTPSLDWMIAYFIKLSYCISYLVKNDVIRENKAYHYNNPDLMDKNGFIGKRRSDQKVSFLLFEAPKHILVFKYLYFLSFVSSLETENVNLLTICHCRLSDKSIFTSHFFPGSNAEDSSRRSTRKKLLQRSFGFAGKNQVFD